jgi:uncharacterized short protein YbdD (DUF466 family)
MRRIVNSVRSSAAEFWWAVRQIFGDAAYENYLHSLQRNAVNGAGNSVPLSQDEFYLDSLRRRYSRISRCC